MIDWQPGRFTVQLRHDKRDFDGLIGGPFTISTFGESPNDMVRVGHLNTGLLLVYFDTEEHAKQFCERILPLQDWAFITQMIPRSPESHAIVTKLHEIADEIEPEDGIL